MRTSFCIDPLTVDPRKCGDLISSSLIFMLYEGLTQSLRDGHLELCLAESVDLSEDSLIYTFHLKEAKWSDGHPITAFDFEYSWKKVLDPHFPEALPHLFFPIKNAELASRGDLPLDQVGIQAIDAKTLRVELERPTPYFLSLISSCNFFPVPRHIATSKLLSDSLPLVSSGPFQLKKWERRKELRLEKNPFYWDAPNTTLPFLNISIISDEFTTLEMFQNGELDWVSSALGALPRSALKAYSQQKKLIPNPSASTILYAYNIHQFPFHNENIRKALFLAIDRKQLIAQVTQLGETPANRLVSPLLDGQEVSLLPPFNPHLAAQTLQRGFMELGILNQEGKRTEEGDLKFRLFLNNLTLSYDDLLENRKVAQFLQDQWRQHLGYRIQLIPQTSQSQTESIYRRNFNMALRYCFAHYNDSTSILERFKYKHLSRNFPQFESNTYIELLNQSSERSFLDPVRTNILLQAESHFLDSMPLAPLYHGNYPILSHPTVSNLTFTGMGNIQLKRAKYLEQQSNFYNAEVS